MDSDRELKLLRDLEALVWERDRLRYYLRQNVAQADQIITDPQRFPLPRADSSTTHSTKEK